MTQEATAYPTVTVGQVEGLADAAYLTDPDGRIAAWNTAAAVLFGYPSDNAVGARCAALLEGVSAHRTPVCVHPCPIVQQLLPTRRASRTQGRASTHPDMVARRSDGGRIGLNVMAMGVAVEGVPMMLHLLRREARSDRDPLTAALNREAFIVRALEEQSRALRTGSTLALALVEVDGLEAINDSLGFSTGDRLLVAVADSLRAGRSASLVGRWGGDQFALLLPDMTDVEATQRLRWTLGLLERSVTVDGRPATVSAGIVHVNPHAALTAAFAAADAAIARARKALNDKEDPSR